MRWIRKLARLFSKESLKVVVHMFRHAPWIGEYKGETWCTLCSVKLYGEKE